MNAFLRYQDLEVGPLVGETVLAALLRAGAPIAHSCGRGVCHACMVKVLEGAIPRQAQRGLSEPLIRSRHMLACQCPADGPMSVGPRDAADAPAQAFAQVEAEPPAPDRALWEELGCGATVRLALESFYDRVYRDPLLRPFFEGVTMDRVVGKQYSFLKQCLTGERAYMGDRPYNSHHWMVIPDALFDHRQRLMVEALRQHGLTPGQIGRWTRVEEHYRGDIVKGQARPRQAGGQPVETESMVSDVLGEATVCDDCGAEIAAGTRVRYHKRLGRVRCSRCSTHGAAIAPAATA